MANTFKLIWSEEALTGLKEIIYYIENKFSEKEVKKFAKKLDKQLKIIQSNPKIFAETPSSQKVRRAIVGKLTSIYFIIDGSDIKIISVYDNRRNPDSLKIK